MVIIGSPLVLTLQADDLWLELGYKKGKLHDCWMLMGPVTGPGRACTADMQSQDSGPEKHRAQHRHVMLGALMVFTS